MEILVGLIALGLLVVPIMALVGLVRSSRLDRESRQLKERLQALELRLDALGRRVASATARGGDAAEPTSDVRGSAEYKRDIVRVFVKRGLDRALAIARS